MKRNGGPPNNGPRSDTKQPPNGAKGDTRGPGNSGNQNEGQNDQRTQQHALQPEPSPIQQPAPVLNAWSGGPPGRAQTNQPAVPFIKQPHSPANDRRTGAPTPLPPNQPTPSPTPQPGTPLPTQQSRPGTVAWRGNAPAVPGPVYPPPSTPTQQSGALKGAWGNGPPGGFASQPGPATNAPKNGVSSSSQTTQLGLITTQRHTPATPEWTLQTPPTLSFPNRRRETMLNAAASSYSQFPMNRIRVKANYVRVVEYPDELYMYSITFKRDRRNRRDNDEDQEELEKIQEMKEAFLAIKDRYAAQLGLDQKIWGTDFRTLWCTTPLFNAEEQHGIHELGPILHIYLNGMRSENLRATFRHTTTLTDFKGELESKTAHEASEYVRSLNGLVSQYISKTRRDIVQVGANKFFIPGTSQEMTGGLRAVRGYFTSIRLSASGVMLNINTVMSAFLPRILVSDLVRNMRSNVITLMDIERMLKGKLVRITYERGTRKRKGKDNVDVQIDLDSEENRVKTFRQFGLCAGTQEFYDFKMKDGKLERDEKGKKIVDPETHRTVRSYFKQELKMEISKDMLCVNVGHLTVKIRSDPPSAHQMQRQSVDGAVWIPANRLEILRDQQVTGTLTSQHTSDMIRKALRVPAVNAELIIDEGLPRLGFTSTTTSMANIGLRVEPKLIEFDANRLADPVLLYKSAKATQKKVTVYRGSWNLINQAFQRPGKLGTLRVLRLRKDTNENIQMENTQMEKFRQDMLRRLKEHGVVVGGRYSPDAQDVIQLFSPYTNPDRAPGLKEWLKEGLKEAPHKGYNLILLPGHSFDDYAMIKRIADLEIGVQTGCVVKKKTFEDQHLSNLALKVNFKAGGNNHHLDSSVLNKILGVERRKKTIILGVDVAHPGTTVASGSPSIACVVGSVDFEFMNYPGSMRLQAGGQERIEDMYGMVRERLETWRAKNQTLPIAMLFYRDGVSESQFDDCIGYEIKAINRAYTDLCGESKGKGRELELTFIVGGKRHHTRFYTPDDKVSHRVKGGVQGNCPPGLLVNSVVTNPDNPEKGYSNFFLQSHAAIQGTARSAHYHVLKNGMGFKGNSLPTLTLHLCAAYPRATKVVSYAAPTYIADRLCERGRAYLREWNTTEGFPLPKNRVDDAGREVRVNDRPMRWTKESIAQWKGWKAAELSRNRTVWGSNYNDNPAHGAIRKNPWHKNLDDTMFWM